MRRSDRRGEGFSLLCVDVITEPQPVPEAIDATFAEAADACNAGDMEACDQLYNETPPGSLDEDYGITCGGRVPARDVTCVDIFGFIAFR